MELFCDLVFVVAIERLTHLLHGDPGRGRIAATIGLTMLVWFAWFNVTALTNVRGGIGPRGRPLMFASVDPAMAAATGVRVRFFAVAFGVLLDTLVTRSVLVPALATDLGNRIWWPGSGRMADDEERG